MPDSAPTGPLVQTLTNPKLYSFEQLDFALALAEALQRGRLILVEKPNGGEDEAG